MHIRKRIHIGRTYYIRIGLEIREGLPSRQSFSNFYWETELLSDVGGRQRNGVEREIERAFLLREVVAERGRCFMHHSHQAAVHRPGADFVNPGHDKLSCAVEPAILAWNEDYLVCARSPHQS